MEFQFYPPGWVTDCFPTTWCSAMTIDSFSAKESTGQLNNLNCLRTVGEEPVNFAFLTFSGKSQAAADPLARALDPTHAAHIPDPAQVLQYNPGDLLSVFLHDTPAGFRVDIIDLTTGQSGSMTASITNGFAQINFVPDPDPAHPSVTCSSNPYAFHAMYSTSLAAQPPREEPSFIPFTAPPSFCLAFAAGRRAVGISKALSTILAAPQLRSMARCCSVLTLTGPHPLFWSKTTVRSLVKIRVSSASLATATPSRPS